MAPPKKINKLKCEKCRKTRTSQDFYDDPTAIYGHSSWCKDRMNSVNTRRADKRLYTDRKEYKGRYNAKYYKSPKDRFINSKNHAKSQGLNWDLTLEDHIKLLTNNCYYCEGLINEYGVGLDRIDNVKGYELNNVLPCCGECNKFRGDRLTVLETLILIQRLKALRKQSNIWKYKKINTYDYYLGIDCETGGLSPQFTLLQIYFGIYDKNFNLIKELKLNIKPDEDKYVVTPEALEVNKINLAAHSKIALTPEAATIKLLNFLKENSKQLNSSFIPIGHNLPFDYNFIFNNLIKREQFEQYCHYSFLDTKQSSEFLIRCQLINPKSTKLKHLAEYFTISYEDQKLHDSAYDVNITIQVYNKLLQLVKNLKENKNESNQG